MPETLAGAAQPPRIPSLLWVALGATFLACVAGGLQVFLFSVKGWMWLVPTAYGLVDIFKHRVARPFPWLLWLPWSVLCLVSMALSPFENAVQRTLMILSPLVVGYACSGLAVDETLVWEILRRLRQFALLLFIVLLGQLGVLTSGELPGVSGIAPQVMTGALLACYFAAGYGFGVPGMLPVWATMAALPVIAVTRTAAAVTGLSLAVTFAPLSWVRRIVIVAVLVGAGLAIFQTERVQRKMFYSGSGSVLDLDQDNPDFRSTGRFALWAMMQEQMRHKPLFGFGANAQEDFIYRQINFRGQPHNDWLRLRFDYGWFGTGLFAVTMLAQALLLLSRAYGPAAPDTAARLLLTAGAGSFVVFAAIMLTDNILLYASFFGILQFALIGCAYAVADVQPAKRAVAPEAEAHTEAIPRFPTRRQSRRTSVVDG